MPVVEVLSSGFAVINRRLWLILVPLFLDFLLWLGPQVTAPPLASRGVEFYNQLVAATPLSYRPSPEVMQEQYAQVQSTLQGLGQVNLLRLLVTPLVFDLLAAPLPSLIATASTAVASPTAFYWGTIGDLRSLLALWLGLATASYLLASLYLSAIARAIKDSSQPWLGEALRGWRKLGLFALLVLAGALILGLPLMLLLSLVGLAVPEVASLLEMGLMVGMAVLLIGLFFVVPAFFIAEAGVLKAIGQSWHLVRHRLRASLGLIALVTIIQWGVSLAWGPLLGHPAGVLVAMAGNAYIATGLAAAVMIFFREKRKELSK